MLIPFVLAAAVATSGVPSVKTGVDRWRAGDDAAAVAAWLPIAAQGDPDALFNMGQAYKLGRGVAKDANVARDYYRKAAAKGHLPAQANLGIALFQAGDKPEAVKWLKTAADRGEQRAQYVLGIAAYNGDGTPKNIGLAYGYLLRAQSSGLAQAATALRAIEPGLAPDARTAGEKIAADLAAGNAPAALAAARMPPPRVAATRPLPTTDTTTTPTAAATPRPVTQPPPAIVRPSPGPGFDLPPGFATPRPAPATTTTRPAAPPAAAPLTTAAAPPSPAPIAADASPRPPATVATPTPRPDAEPKPALRTEAAAASRDASDTSPAAQVDLPKPKPAASRPVAKVEPPKAAGWRVQLGAFATRALAEAAWAKARADQPPKAKPIYDFAGTVVKLQVGPYPTREAARDACAKLAFAGRACFVTGSGT